MIAGSLVFMVLGFVFLILGRGSEPNAFQFLSIAASLMAGTLLVMGYLKERKRRPAKTQPADTKALEKAGVISDKTSSLGDVEADLKALEDGTDEIETEPAASERSEPLVTSARAGANKTRRSRQSRKETPVLQPAMVGATPGPIPDEKPAVMASSTGSAVPDDSRGAMIPDSMAEQSSMHPTAGGGIASVSQAASGSSQGGEQSTGPTGKPAPNASEAPETRPIETSEPVAPGLSSPNSQWASLISKVDEEKFEPPAFEKPKSKGRSDKQQGKLQGDPRKGNIDMRQPAATASDETTAKPEKSGRGFLGLFRRRPAAEAPAPAGVADKVQGPVVGGQSTDVAPAAVAEELSAAGKEVASEHMQRPEAGAVDRTPETAPIGERMDMATDKVGEAAPTGAVKSSAKRKSPAKPKTAAKSKTAAKPKAAAQPRTPGKSKTAGRPKAKTTVKARPEPSPKRKPVAGKPKATRAAAKPKSSGRGKTGGPAGGAL